MQRLGVAYLAPKGMKFDDKKFLHLLGTTMDKIQDHYGSKLIARVSFMLNFLTISSSVSSTALCFLRSSK